MTLSADLVATAGEFRLEAAIDAAPGEVLAVLGPNGSGKSTLLGALAGHRRITSGHIELDGRSLAGVAPEHRRVGLLGQRAMLFPHLTALENVAFGARSQGVGRRGARASAQGWLEAVGLGEFAQRKPAELSGGQQQRAAIARALAAEPAALLLDEPFAALDAQTATQARRLVAELRDRAGIPMVLVTHDAMDAIVLASRTLVLGEGRIAQSGPTAEVLGHPRTAFVAAMAGVNLASGVWTGGGSRGTDLAAAAGGLTAPTGPTGLDCGGGLILTGPGAALAPGDHGSAVFAPGSVRVRAAGSATNSHPIAPAAATPSAPAVNRWAGTVRTLEPSPGGVRIITEEHPDLAIDCPSSVAVRLDLDPGTQLEFSVSEEDVSIRAAD